MCTCNNVCKCEPPKQSPKVGEIWTAANEAKYRIIEIRGELGIVEFLTSGLGKEARGSVYWYRLDQLVKQFKEPKKLEAYVCLTISGGCYLLLQKPETVLNYIGWKKITITEGEFDT